MASKSQDGVEKITKGVGGLGIDGGEEVSTAAGYVYVIKEVRPPVTPSGTPSDNGSLLYKLGLSVDPDKRRSDLQTGNARKLVILLKKQVKDMTAAEGKLKDAFKVGISSLKHWNGGTEWFTAGSDQEVQDEANKALKDM